MDETTRTRIDSYRPTVTLPDDASLEAVREAVRRAEPDDVRQAALLLHAAARHVRWATANGHDGSVGKLFAPGCVAASIAAAEATSTSSVSPYRSRLNKLAAAVVGGRGSATRRPGSSDESPLTPPHSAAEIAALRVAGRGMNLEEQSDLEAALALGAGAGLVGPLASLVQAEHLTDICGHTVVCGPGFGPVIVREPWGEILRTIAESREVGPLTHYYTIAGRQRVRRGLAQSPHVPDFQAHRLRTGWLTELLSVGVPLDVVAELAGISVGSLHRYVALSAPLARSNGTKPDDVHFTGLRKQPAEPTPERRSVTEVLERQRPQDVAVAAMWSSDEAEPFRERIRDHARMGNQAQDLLTAVFVLLEWAIQQPGLPLRPEALLKETTLGRWAAVQRAEGLADGSVAAYLSRLRRLSAASSPAPERVGHVVASGYPEAEQQTLTNASDPSASLLSPRLRRFLATHLHAQLGGGVAGHEVAKLLESSVQREGRGIQLRVGGTSLRLVPVFGVHAEGLEKLVTEASDGPLIGVAGHDLQRYRAAISEQIGIEFDPRRLQATWITDQVRSGASAQTLTLGTGLSLAALAPQVKASCEPRSLAEVVAWSGWPATELRHG